MARKERQKTYFTTPAVETGGTGLPGTKNASATLTTASSKTGKINQTVLTLTAQTATIAAASDFGSLLLFTFPASRVLFLGADVQFTCTKSGTADDSDHTGLDVALGSVAASNTTLASTMVDLVAKVDATGTTTGTVSAASTPTEAPKFKAASTAVYLNIADPVTTGTGTYTITGTVKIWWIDAGSAA